MYFVHKLGIIENEYYYDKHFDDFLFVCCCFFIYQIFFSLNERVGLLLLIVKYMHELMQFQMDNIWNQSELVLFLKMQREKILINKTVTRESTPFRDNLMLRKKYKHRQGEELNSFTQDIETIKYISIICYIYKIK